MLYAVTITYTLRGKSITDTIIRNITKDEAEKIAADHRAVGFPAEVQEYPAIPTVVHSLMYGGLPR